MEQRAFVIRPAQANDGAAVASVYGPYVQDTAVSFEVEPPTGAAGGAEVGFRGPKVR